MNKFQKREMRRLAMQYQNDTMWAYVDCFKDEYKKPNQVDKLRLNGSLRQSYKRAKKFVLDLEKIMDKHEDTLKDERMDD